MNLILLWLSLSILNITAIPMSPPSAALHTAKTRLDDSIVGPAGCHVVYDANMSQEEHTDAVASCIIRRPDGLVWDLLIVDDFDASSAGTVTDVYLYLAIIHPGQRAPSDGVRISLWGNGEVPSEEPTQTWDIPPSQVRFWSLGWFGVDVYEIQATDLSIPYSAGKNWISIQPRDLLPGAQTYFLLRNDQLPLRGHDSYVKDGPESQTPGYGFTDWRTAGSQGYDVADSFIRLETCDGPGTLNISLAGQCGGAVTFSWENAPPNKTMNVIYARETGEFRLGHTHGCPTTLLGLGRQGLREVFRVETGAGSGSVHGRLRASACPGYSQAVIGGAGPCQVSNVIGTP